MKKCALLILAPMFLLIMSTVTMATTIEYTDTDNGGDNYTLQFKVFNDTLTEDIEWFSIYFGQTTDGLSFSNVFEFSGFSPDEDGLGPEPQPADWDSYSFEPSAIDMPGQFNSDALISGITPGPGSFLGGFTVSFNWTGTGSYDNLYFEVGNFDAVGDYNTLDDGYTEKPGTAPVPEPATMTFLIIGLAGLGIFRKRETA